MTKPVFNPPPGWPVPPAGWVPPKGWQPDPSWPSPPPNWQLWIHPSNEQQPARTQAVVPPPKPTRAVAEGGTPDLSEQPARAQAVVPPPKPTRAVAEGGTPDVRISRLEAENAALKAQLASLSAGSDIVVLNDERVLQDVGIYRYHHPLENAAAYQERMRDLVARIADAVKTDHAIEKSNMFTFENSLAKGRKMASDLAKLMLRAYNAEADNSVRSLRAGNVVTAKKRLEASRDSIAKLGSMMEMRISDAFHKLRLEEIELTSDYLMKKQEEREAAREERARLREERKLQAELQEERARLEKERSHLLNAVTALKELGAVDPDLETKLRELDEAISQNEYRTANIRAGYVYVISNRGAFGDNVVKIGLTRRLEPIERIDELGGASVPFRFDVHALFFSEDAVTLETQLHQHFAAARLNHANPRKEFFFATPADVREVLISKVGSLLEFTEHAESTDYLQSVGAWTQRRWTATA